jgi:hypothetical protein
VTATNKQQTKKWELAEANERVEANKPVAVHLAATQLDARTNAFNIDARKTTLPAEDGVTRL